MVLIGLTGGIGMGKSTVAEFLVSRGERVVDTDALARELVRPGETGLEEIRREFGGAVLHADGSLNRSALAALVFAEASRRRALELILHPRIREAWRARTADWRREGARRGVVIIPLLFETGAEGEFDRTVCVACSEETQRKRLAARDWDAKEIERRVAAQWPIARKMDLAGGVVWNEGDLELCRAQAERLFELAQ
jgi:dephospho-CoA kinase